MDITRLDPADAGAVSRWFDLERETGRHDVPDFPEPCWYDTTGRLHHPYPDENPEHWVAVDGGELVGFVHLGLPRLDNAENVWLDLAVHPAHRRRGVGQALYELAVERAKANGRVRLHDTTVEALPGGPPRDGAGTAFATALGAERANEEIRRRLDLATADDAVLAALLADAWGHAAGYSLATWGLDTPDEYVDDVALLDSRLITDAPMGELKVEPNKVDAARVRAAEEVLRLRRRRAYNAGLVHDATGRLVAWTTIGLAHQVPQHGWQNITIVHPEHRGHRLGLVAKLENLAIARAHEPAMRTIDTWNAATNRHMIAINETMGFRAVDRWADWQRDI